MPPGADPNLTNEQPAKPILDANEPAPSGQTIGADQRQLKRQRVLKIAQLIQGFSGSTFDCLVIDETRLGVMLETYSTMQIAEQVKIRVIGGQTFDALRRWAIGNRIGLEYAGLFPENETTQQQIRAVKTVFRDAGVRAAVQKLRELDFLESSEVRAAAEAVELAIARLESLLT